MAAASRTGVTLNTLSKSPQLLSWYQGPLQPVGWLLFLGSVWGFCDWPRRVDCPAIRKNEGGVWGAGLRYNKGLTNAWDASHN